jgi:hypothetical protein
MSSSPPISVFFNNFWPGFIENTDIINSRFFIQLLSNTYNAPIHVSRSPNDATILVESIFGNHSYLKYKKWRATILFTGEADYCNMHNVDQFDCVLGFEDTHGSYVKCPLFVIFLFANPSILKQIETVDIDIPIPPNNASIILSNGHHGNIRNEFFMTIRKEMTVFSGGRYENNVGSIVPGSYNSSEMVDFYRRGKFAITMENNDKPYYVTEKLVNGLRAGVIPIYWGTSRVTEFFNPRRFFHLCPNPTKQDMERMITKMKFMTDKEFLDIIKEPILAQPIGDIFDELLSSVKKILT